jgi:hypothetical protein
MRRGPEYHKALEKAKADSIEFENHAIFYPDLKLCTTPDSFIECEIGEVEIGWQWRPYDTSPWQDTNEYYATTVRCGGNPCAQVRKVARIKTQPAEANDVLKQDEIVDDWKARAIAHLSEDKPRCECELFVEKYFGLSPKFPEDWIVVGADYGNLVNMLAMFKEEQLAAAEKRIGELEEENKRLWNIAHDCSN